MVKVKLAATEGFASVQCQCRAAAHWHRDHHWQFDLPLAHSIAVNAFLLVDILMLEHPKELIDIDLAFVTVESRKT